MLEIEPASPLPTITTAVNINGLSQPGSTAASPLIQINGSSAGSYVAGLQFERPASGTATTPIQVRGLEITDSGGDGVDLNGASYVDLNDLIVLFNGGAGVSIYGGASYNTIGGTAAGSRDVISANGQNGVSISGSGTTGNLVEGDLIGTNSSGSNGLGNNSAGVLIQENATYNTIGGTTAAARDVISDSVFGVQMFDSGTSHNVVEGDYIGLSPSGTAGLGNQTGVEIFSDYNTIGGSVAGAGDVISGNSADGVDILDGASGNVVDGDYIGSSAGGTAGVANAGNGVSLYEGASNNTIGGTTATARDVISGNSGNGVDIVTTYIPGDDYGGTDGNVVEGDYIGLTSGGTVALANALSGVAIGSGASNNTVGGSVAGSGDVISGNTGDGVYISDLGTNENVVEGDIIGTGGGGMRAVPNYDGVVIQNGAADNTIGGTSAAARDLISGNTEDGVHIVDSGTQGNVVEGDYIGLAVGGSTAVGNGASGVAIFAGASNNTIGGTAAGSGDVISGTVGDGLYITGGGTNANVVEGSYIGTDYTGTIAVHNNVGVYIGGGATNNTIGGTSSSARDVISGNTAYGVQLFNVGTAGNVVEGDYIGLASGGTSALANGVSGVAIYGSANNNTIGGSVAGSGDVISGNTDNGVYISDSGTVGNVVEGDLIGTGAGGTHGVPNYDGVVVQNGAADNTIGGTTAAARDVISGNTEDGVHIVDSGTQGNVVEGDYIGVNIYGTAAVGNGASGVAIYASASNNTLGGTASGSGDVISGNVGDGIYISLGGTNANVVEGDFIGTDYTGTISVQNNLGVYIGGGATNNTIGGTSAAARDVISGNTTDGVQIFSLGSAATSSRGTTSGSPPAAPQSWATGPAAWPSSAAPITTPSAGQSPAPAM